MIDPKNVTTVLLWGLVIGLLYGFYVGCRRLVKWFT